MTREQLLALGYTEEQVNQIMALHGQATQQIRATVNQHEATIQTLNGQITQLQSQNKPNEPEPAPQPTENPELAEAQKQIAQLREEMNRKDIAVYASSKGLSGEQADNVLKAFGSDVELAKSAIDSISQIISDTDKSARDAEKQALLNQTPNPSGNPVGGDEKSSAEKIAENLFGGQKQENDILSHYLN